RHSAMHELRVVPPGKRRRPPGSATTLHWASQPLPGCPLSGPASHSSSHSTRLLPQPSWRQLALHPSHEDVLPSSHCSPGSRVPSPQEAVWLGQGVSVVFTAGTVGGLIVPVIVGGVAGSRYSMTFALGGVVISLPRIVTLPPAWTMLPNPRP